eukprot:1187585-Prorocentrum_minimum.AAC.4
MSSYIPLRLPLVSAARTAVGSNAFKTPKPRHITCLWNRVLPRNPAQCWLHDRSSPLIITANRPVDANTTTIHSAVWATVRALQDYENNK